MAEQRNVALCVILTIVTCGIYGIYWFICLVNDLNYATGDVQSPSGGMVFLLDIVTCGIYGLYWCYKAGDKIDRVKQQWGIPSSNTGILYLILSLIGLDIVVWALVQSEVNGMMGGAGAFFCLAGLGGGAQLPYRRQRAADKAAECRRVRGHCSAGGLWHCAKSAGLLVFAPACLTVTTEKKTAPLWPENRLQRCSFLDALRRRAGAQGLAEQPVLCAVPN